MSVGVGRRLRAMIAIGWTEGDLAYRLNWPVQMVADALADARVPAGADYVVARFYDRHSMTPGRSMASRERASALRWAPPLAWDDDELDDPNGCPQNGWSRRQSRQRFDDLYRECKELGYSDIEMTHRFSYRADSLVRLMERYGFEVSPELATAAGKQRKRGKVTA
jgi:hypothetical protein